MMFTALFGYVGVGVVSLAVSEVLETLKEIQANIQNRKMEEIAALLEKANVNLGTDADSKTTTTDPRQPGLSARFDKWSKTNALTRVVRVMIPLGFISLLGALLLVSTEEDGSDIMSTEIPFVTGLYVSIITGVTTGYGDFYPTTVSRRTAMSCAFCVST